MIDFSIITPTLNQDAYLNKNIESVSEQNNVTLEHIVIDGLSSDNTLSILSNYKSNHDLLWISEKDNGQTEAINKGLRLSKGKILSYLNSDDYLYSENVLHQVKSLMEKTGADILYGDVMVVDEVGMHKRSIHGRPFRFRKLIELNYIPQPATFFRASVVERIGYFREELVYAMDLEYWLRAAKNDLKFQYEPILFSCFREHQKSKTCSQTRKLIDEGYNVVRTEYFPKKRMSIWMYYNLSKLKLFLRNNCF